VGLVDVITGADAGGRGKGPATNWRYGVASWLQPALLRV